MVNDIFTRHNLRRVINCSGTETPFGASPVRQEVIDAITELVPHSVFISDLQLAASRSIATVIGSEAGCITGCTAASISIAVAASMTGIDFGLIEQLPDTSSMKNEVVMLRGHAISYAHHVEQNIRLTGAKVVEVGAATDAGLYQLRHAITERTTAALYVVSPLAINQRVPDLASFVKTCHERKIPVIVDAASMTDPRIYLASGADLILWSAHKSMGSITGGYIAGRKSLVRACLLQEHGIGRPMKAGKESIIGAMAALNAWAIRNAEAEDGAVMKRAARMAERLALIPGFITRLQGRQVHLKVDSEQAGTSASAIATRLANSDPAILVWAHHASQKELLLSAAKISDETADAVCLRIEQIVQEKVAEVACREETYSDQMRHRALDWTEHL